MVIRSLTLALLLPLAAAVQAGDFEAEKFLDQNCTRCHDSSVYTRDDRRVQSLDQLNAQVRRCDSMIGTKLYDDEINLLVEYLNQRYYHF